LTVLCQQCGKKPAEIHFTEIADGEVKHLHLCSDCAGQKELSPPTPEKREEPSEHATSLLEVLQKLLASDSDDVSLECAQCGLTYADFKGSGRLGCGHCYEEFQEKLAPLLKRVHSADSHRGKVPECMDEKIRVLRERARLRRELARAVREEAFERAAELRDQIRAVDESIAQSSEDDVGPA
jgi:protein arginine kinase activator